MTLPRERSYALRNTRNFLRRLLDPKETPRVPNAVRREAHWCLKHFPADFEVRLVAEEVPEVFGKIEKESS